jgi:ABC-type multidrug transport system fused ATPase/permease subunit
MVILRADIFQSAPLSFFVVTDTGDIVNRFSQDMTLVDMQLPMSFMQSYSRKSLLCNGVLLVH